MLKYADTEPMLAVLSSLIVRYAEKLQRLFHIKRKLEYTKVNLV